MPAGSTASDLRLCCRHGIIGHLGDVTVEHVAHHLPIIVRDFLRDADPSVHLGTYSPQAISELFTKAMIAFDDAIAHDVLDLFGGTIDNLEKYSEAEICETINDQHLGGANWRKARLCMYGTTALVALVDPDHKDLWIANLGDCQASELQLLCPSISVGLTTFYLYQSWFCQVAHLKIGSLKC